MRTYAHRTKVPVERSQMEVQGLLRRHGATSFGIMDSPQGGMMVCELKGLRLKFEVKRTTDTHEHMRLWRVMLLRVKCRLEEIASGDTTVEEAFMPYIMLPDGHTVGSYMVPAIRQAYVDGKMPSLALEYRP